MKNRITKGSLMLGVGVGIGLAVGLMLPRALGLVESAVPAAAAQEPLVTPGPAEPTPVPVDPTPVPTPASNRHTIVVDVAQNVSSAVVSIGVTKTAFVPRATDGYDPFSQFSGYLQQKQNFPYLGSGFIIDEQGHVVTNYHVVQDAQEITVTLTNGKVYAAKLLDADRFIDVALLAIERQPEETLPFVQLGDSNDIFIGETVLAIGNPFGPLIADPRPSVSVGVVSAVKRSFNPDGKQGQIRAYQDMIQSDAAINPGNSGGPLVNLDSQVIGINTFIFSRSGDSASVGFSIPINQVKKVINEILTFGRVRALWMDFEARDLTPYVRQALKISARNGALIWSTDIGGPAEKAGLEPGDVVVQVDGKTVNNRDSLLTNLLSRTVGEKLTLKIRRGEQELELTYEIGEGTQN